MATRGRHARDDGQKEFTGRVRKWSRTWVASKEPKTKELKFRRWLQTDERPPELAGPRLSYIEPLKDPEAKPYPLHRALPPALAVNPAGVLPPSAAVGAPGMKRGKSQASIAANGAQPAASTGAGAAAAPSKFKLKFTLSQRLDAATAGTDGVGAGSMGPPAAVPPTGAAAPAGAGLVAAAAPAGAGPVAAAGAAAVPAAGVAGSSGGPGAAAAPSSAVQMAQQPQAAQQPSPFLVSAGDGMGGGLLPARQQAGQQGPQGPAPMHLDPPPPF